MSQNLFIEEILQCLKTFCKRIEEGWPNLWCHKEYKVMVGDDVRVDDDDRWVLVLIVKEC